MRKNFLKIFLFIVLFPLAAKAQNSAKFPNISGNTLFLFQADRVSTNKNGVSPNNAFVFIDSNLSMNFNKNWSVKTNWRLQPNNVLTTRNSTYPERYRTFLQSDRGLNIDENGLLIEELKVNYENEDMRVFAGKFDPTFGSAWRKTKRIGIFTWQFTEDYNLREKIGGGLTAMLENSNLSINTFFNDTSSLSNSALNKRGRASRNNGEAGDTGTFSSYSLAMDGENLFGVENWFYNLGYRSLGVDNFSGRAREKGYVIGSEYLIRVGHDSALIPFFEGVKIDNFTGTKGRNAYYTTWALIGRYSSWSTSASFITRNIKTAQSIPSSSDRQLQFSVGYKFTDNLTLDVTHASIKEAGNSGNLIGAMMSYVYKF